MVQGSLLNTAFERPELIQVQRKMKKNDRKLLNLLSTKILLIKQWSLTQFLKILVGCFVNITIEKL